MQSFRPRLLSHKPTWQAGTTAHPIRVALIDPRLIPANDSAPAPCAASQAAPPRPLPRSSTPHTPRYAHLRFYLVGLFGCAVDAGTLFGLVERFEVTPLPARVISLMIAITASWAVHRRWTYRAHDPRRIAEWSRALTTSLVCAAVNFAIYAAVLLALPGTPFLLALGMGTAVALGASIANTRLAPSWHLAARPI